MRSIRMVSIFFVVLLFLPREGVACERCLSTLSLEETISQADEIAVAERDPDENIAEPDPNATELDMSKLPEFIHLKILKVLKGEPLPPVVRVQSYSGMCRYGIYFRKGVTALVFLKRTPDFYTSVAGGCSKTSIPLGGNTLNLDGKKITLQTFTEKYLAPSPPKDQTP
ncbi:MAG: hypothetical protein PHW76_06030 [Alphaproteobacteria bacterium]|nr:hypothetical protein [Alphaproteobacteria bacterium]